MALASAVPETLVDAAGPFSGGRRGDGLERGRKPPKLIHHLARDLRRHPGLAAMHRAHRFEHFIFARILQQVGMGTGADRLEDHFFGVERSQHQHVRVGQRPRDFARGGHATLARHVQIHQHDIGTQPLRHLHGFHAVGCLAHHFDIRLDLEHQRHPPPDQGLIIDHEHPDARSVVRRSSCHLTPQLPTSRLVGARHLTQLLADAPDQRRRQPRRQIVQHRRDRKCCLGRRDSSPLGDQLYQLIHFEIPRHWNLHRSDQQRPS